MKKKIYLSGKITDLPMEEVQAKFEQAENHFIKQGYDVVNPLKLDDNHDKSWASYMIVCLHALIPCDEVAALHDHYASPGALIEIAFAQRMNKPVHWCDFRT